MHTCGMWVVYCKGVGFLRDKMYLLGQWILILEARCTRIGRQHQATLTLWSFWILKRNSLLCRLYYCKYTPGQLVWRSLERHTNESYQNSHQHLHIFFPQCRSLKMIYWLTPEFWDCCCLYPSPSKGHSQTHLTAVSWGPLAVTSSFKPDFLGTVCLMSVLSFKQAQYLEWWHLHWIPSGSKWSALCITLNHFSQHTTLELQIGFASGWSRLVLWNEKQRNALGCWCSARHTRAMLIVCLYH